MEKFKEVELKLYERGYYVFIWLVFITMNMRYVMEMEI